jgi:dTDP-6-deoxy-L-talose 4-dehydrogenase (NAD+)
VNVAVSGATGFIGRHAVAELEQRGVPVTLVVRSNSRLPAGFEKHPVVRIDGVADAARWYAAAGRPDTLIHLAWGGLPHYRSLHHFETELPAQYEWLKVWIESGLKTLVVAGTCFEYGLQSGPLSETMQTRPANPYGLAKDVLRRQLEYLQQRQPFAFNWARLFYLHGEGQAETSLWPQLQRATARGDRVFPMSGGEQLRDYLPVTQAASHLVELALAQADNGVVNVCSGQPISVRRLVEGWIEDNGWAIEPAFGRYPYPDHEPMAFWGDRHKLDRIRLMNRGTAR